MNKTMKIEDVNLNELEAYQRRGYRIAVDVIKPRLDLLEKDSNAAKYISVDAGGSKSVSVSFITMLSDRQFILATDSKDRCAKDYFPFKPETFCGKEVLYNAEHDAILITKENRINSMMVAKKRGFHILVLTTQYLCTLSEAETRRLVEGKIVIVDECWSSCITHNLNIGARIGASSSSDDVIPYAALEQLEDETILLDVREANKIVKETISATKSEGIIVPDNARALYASAASSIAKDSKMYGMELFKECLDTIANHRVIAAKSADKTKTSIIVPTNLKYLCEASFCTLNLDATCKWNTTREMSEFEELSSQPLSVNANISFIDAASGYQHYKDAYRQDKTFYDGLMDWLDTDDNCAIVPKDVWDDMSRQTGHLTYYGKDDKGSNAFRHCHNIFILGGGSVPSYVNAALALFMLEDSGNDAAINTYEDILKTDMYMRITSDRTTARLIQAMYRSNIRVHDDNDSHTNIYIILNQNEQYCPGNKRAIANIKEYMAVRGATFNEEPLPFVLEKHVKEKNWKDFANKKGETGEFVRWLIDNNLEPSKQTAKMYRKAGGSLKHTTDALAALL